MVNRFLSPDGANSKNSDSSDNEQEKTKKQRKRKLPAATKSSRRKRTCNKKDPKQRESAGDDSSTRTTDAVCDELEQRISAANSTDKAAQTTPVQGRFARSSGDDTWSPSDDSSDDLGERTRRQRVKNKRKGKRDITVAGRQNPRLTWKEKPELNFDVLQTADDNLELGKDVVGLSEPPGSVTSGNFSTKKRRADESISSGEPMSKLRQCEKDSDSTSSDSNASGDTASDMFTGVTRKPSGRVFSQSRSIFRGRGRRRDTRNARGRRRSNVKN